jgi:hypothetical protein
MFASRAGAYLSEGWAHDLTHKHETRLESPVRDEYFSLLRTFVNYGCKNFITLAIILSPACWQHISQTFFELLRIKMKTPQ